MIELKINITEDNDICVSNSETNKNFILNRSNNELKAIDIWELIDYSPGKQYAVLSDFQDESENTDIEFCNEFCDFFKKMIAEINKLSENTYKDVTIEELLQQNSNESLVISDEFIENNLEEEGGLNG